MGGAHGFLGAGGTACRRGTGRNTQRSSAQKSAQEVRTKRRARELVWAVRARVWETVAHAGQISNAIWGLRWRIFSKVPFLGRLQGQHKEH